MTRVCSQGHGVEHDAKSGRARRPPARVIAVRWRNTMRRNGRMVLALVAVAGVVLAAVAVSKTDAGPPVCPQIYAPVVCDNGKTYPNQCEADRHHAKNCVPLGL